MYFVEASEKFEKLKKKSCWFSPGSASQLLVKAISF